MSFFKDTYELNESLPFGEDPQVISMENEFNGLLQENGYIVKNVDYDYFDGIIHNMDFELENKIVRLTHDDDGVPCIDVVIEREIIYTIRPKEEVDLHNFVKDLG